MAQRLIKRSFTWAPRALAVISCALALLAVQPNLQANSARTGVRPRAVAVREAGAIGTQEAATRSHPALAIPAVSQRMESSFFSQAHRLHVLATVEILHRLLISELQIPQTQLLPMIWFQQVCLEVLPAAGIPSHSMPAAADPSPPSIERAFALHHCLLAPPLS